jgi:threonine synthase
MDILISSNLERLLFDLLGCDDEKLKSLMEDLKEKGSYKIDEALHSKLKEIFYGGFCDDAATKEEIKKTFSEYEYVSDTHTAVAIKVYDDYVKQTGDKTKTVIASTANPYKFNQAVLEAITDKNVENADEFALIDELSKLTGLIVPKELDSLKEKQVRFDKTVEKNELLFAVKEALNIK